MTRSQHPVAALQAAGPRPAAPVRAGLPHTAALRRGEGAGPAHPRPPHVPAGGHGLPVLHLVDQAAGRRPARRRAGGRAARVRGRPAGQDDYRLQAPGGGRQRDQGLAAEPRGPARVARRDLQQGRHGPRDGRRRQLRRRRRSTSPPRASASPAPRSSRSCSPRRCGRASARSRRGRRRRRSVHPQGRRALHRQQLRGRLRRRAPRWPARRRSPTTRSTPRSRGRSRPRNVARLAAPDGHPHAGLDEPRDVARRPAPGRHAARHGARLRDVRDRRQAGLRHALARPARQERCRCPARSGSSGSTSVKSGKARVVELDDGTKMINRTKTKRRARSRTSPRQVGAILPDGGRPRHRRRARRSRAW